MLSWSAEITQTPLDLRAVIDPAVDPLMPGGRAVLDLTDAVLRGSRSEEPVGCVRDQLGERGLMHAVAVIGNFQMMNRVADGTGMPVSGGTRSRLAGLISELELDRFDHQS